MTGRNQACWHDSDVVVTMELVPRYCWMTATVDVHVAKQCILRSGGVLKERGQSTVNFRHDGKDHVADLVWKTERDIAVSYKLLLDGELVMSSKIHPRNWALCLVPLAILIAVMVGLISLVNFLHIGLPHRPR